MRYGAWLEDDGVRFRVWAPGHDAVSVVLFDKGGAPAGLVPMRRDKESPVDGSFAAQLPGGRAGLLYKFKVDTEGPFPDPWSRAQPLGVHGPSQVIDPSHAWRDGGFVGRPLDELILYELHVGTFTREGTFRAIIDKLAHLRDLGVTAIELMPIASFPGQRNWGYDGVSFFAPHAGYGGPTGLKELVDAAHAVGLMVVLDVVYNHLGPDGNYLRCFSTKYFTARHHTPWGEALNLDDDGSAVVRELVLSSVEQWIRDYHVDGLRLDATHELHDDSPSHILADIARRARDAAGERRVFIIAEDDRNEAKLIRPCAAGGFGLDAVWADDFHHQLRVALTGESEGYYRHYSGSPKDLARTLERGWFYEGQTSAFGNKPRGTSADGLIPQRFVHCIQNHDQVGNRPFGDRLSGAVSPGAYRAASALLLLSPYTPLLFMGQEWGAKTPFLYFTDHHAELGRLVTEGRRREFKEFSSFHDAEVPDPQSPHTFVRSCLDWSELEVPEHAALLALHRELLSLRRTHPALIERARAELHVRPLRNGLLLERRGGGRRLLLILALRGELVFEPDCPVTMVLSTEDPRFGGRRDALALDFDAGALRLVGVEAALLEAPFQHDA